MRMRKKGEIVSTQRHIVVILHERRPLEDVEKTAT
jgi:hypothetical protein